MCYIRHYIKSSKWYSFIDSVYETLRNLFFHISLLFSLELILHYIHHARCCKEYKSKLITCKIRSRTNGLICIHRYA